MIDFVLSLLLIVGVGIYCIKAKYFFLYWLGIQPYILPILYLLFGNSMLPFEEKYLQGLYFRFPYDFCGLIFILTCVSYVKEKSKNGNVKVFIKPLFFLVLFLTIQNFLIGFRIGSLYANIANVLFTIAPFMLLLIDKTVRPSRDSFIHFIMIFVLIQLLFSVLNYGGFRVYGEVTGIFDDSLIAGTFCRYNHMANYLAIFFLVLTYEYYFCKRLNVITYYCMTFLIGLIIVLSGSRMTLILLCFTFFFYFSLSHKIKVVFLTFFGGLLLFHVYVIGNETYKGQNADEGTGLERNLIGIIDLANSDDLSEGSTLTLSAYLLIDKFHSPIIGNGRAYRGGDNFYGHPTDTWNEAFFRTDARLAFMLVEYGIVGLFLFFLLYASVFKGCFLYGSENMKPLYWGAFFYFILFSLTDNGFWDHVVLSVLFIYAFSVKSERIKYNSF